MLGAREVADAAGGAAARRPSAGRTSDGRGLSSRRRGQARDMDAIGFFIASINSFLLNKAWAFRDQRREAVVRQYFTFLFFTLVGLALHTGAFALLLVPLDVHGQIGRNLALLCALPVSVIWNFTSYRLWTFRTQPRPS